MTKFIFITGGVVSGLGKGITAASLGRLLKARGLTVTMLKFDPYLNVDSSNLSPYQHGEIFVTDDGTEGDLVLGHYERILDENLGEENDVTTGQVFSDVIAKERRGEYDGSTVQIVPHVTADIKERILAFDGKSDVVIVDVGGTVGDIECTPFLEAVRQCRNVFGKNNAVYIHVTLVPYIGVSGEQKTKPTQHSVKELQNIGIQPDVIVCRSDFPLAQSSKDKLALFCNVDKDCIIENITTDNLFAVPLLLEEQGLSRVVCRKLNLTLPEPDLAEWRKISERFTELCVSEKKIRVAIVGKYVEKPDAYLSIAMALVHSAIENGVWVEPVYIQSGSLKPGETSALDLVDGIIIPGGFGHSGFEGKVIAARYAREHDVPVLMIGLGAQAGLVEYARDVMGKDADSTEFEKKTPYPVAVRRNDGNSFRKGAFITRLESGSRLAAIYGKTEISERRRHKYEFNKALKADFKKFGLNFTGESKDGKLPEAYEIDGKKFSVGVIYHPEYLSRPTRPHPLFSAFVGACKK